MLLILYCYQKVLQEGGCSLGIFACIIIAFLWVRIVYAYGIVQLPRGSFGNHFAALLFYLGAFLDIDSDNFDFECVEYPIIAYAVF